MRSKKRIAEEFVALVLELGLPLARQLLSLVADHERKRKHAARERPKTRERKIAALEGRPKMRKGFAVMDPERVSAIAQMGGRANHARGTAHEFTRKEARSAGKKGGLATAKNKRSLSGAAGEPRRG